MEVVLLFEWCPLPERKWGHRHAPRGPLFAGAHGAGLAWAAFMEARGLHLWTWQLGAATPKPKLLLCGGAHFGMYLTSPARQDKLGLVSQMWQVGNLAHLAIYFLPHTTDILC